MASYDAASAGNTAAINATSLTVSHTTSGTNRVLVVGVNASGTNTPTSVTYAGIPMTKNGTTTTQTNSASLWVLYNPASGANNIVATFASSVAIAVGGVSVNGARQTNDGLITTSAVSAGATGIAATLNTISSNAILIDLGMNVAQNTGNMTFGTGQNSVVNQQQASPMTQAMSYEVISSPSSQTQSQGSGIFSEAWAYKVIIVEDIDAPQHVRFNNSGLRPHLFSPGLAR